MAKMGKTEKWFMNRQGHNINAANRAERMLQYVDLRKNQNFLEIGCGNGAACKYIAKKYKMNVVGVDIDPEQIQNANKHMEDINNIQFSEGDSTNLNFNDNEFDIVYSSGVLHHIGNWDKTLEEINRILRSGGYYIFVDLAYSHFTTRLFKSWAKKYGVYTIEDIIDFMKNQNFEILQQEKPEGVLLKTHAVIFRKS